MMEWPNPQPGHQVMPMSFSGHKVKCDVAWGEVKASDNIAAIQKTSSKYFEKSFLINLV
jgi:phage baseplate assembly protein gpV